MLFLAFWSTFKYKYFILYKKFCFLFMQLTVHVLHNSRAHRTIQLSNICRKSTYKWKYQLVLEIYWFTHAPTHAHMHARMQVCTHWWCPLQYRLFDVRLNWLSVSWTIKGFELMWNGETFATFWILVFCPQNLIKRLFLRRAKLHISTSHTRYALCTSVYLPVRVQTTQLPSLTVCIYRFSYYSRPSFLLL